MSPLRCQGVRVGGVRRVAVLILVIVLAGSSRSDAQPSSLQALLNRISDLSAHKRFAEAESIARTGVDRFPHSRNTRLALSRVLLWESKYSEVQSRFRELVATNSRDVEARFGLAQAEY